MQFTRTEAAEPRGSGRRDARRDDLRNMTVDVVAEQRRRLLGDHAQTSVRQKARLDQRLETVADAQDQAAAVGQSVDFVANILIVQHIDNEFGASVGFVARRETACEHEDVRPADMLLHFGDRA